VIHFNETAGFKSAIIELAYQYFSIVGTAVFLLSSTFNIIVKVTISESFTTPSHYNSQTTNTI